MLTSDENSRNFIHESPRILVIRRDNIGDLICTTPLLHAMRLRYPKAYIAVVASSYNVDVLEGNADVDDIFVFPKRTAFNFKALKVLWQRFLLIRTLRKIKFDYLILANGGWRFASKLGGKTMIGFHGHYNPDHEQPDIIVPLESRGLYDHEVVKMAKLGEALDIHDALGPLRIFPRASIVDALIQELKLRNWKENVPTIAVHISARHAVRLWPEASFIGLIKTLINQLSVQVILLWSPGKENDPLIPGDDHKAERMFNEFSHLPVFLCPTRTIPELFAIVSLVDQMICSDGGAMHVAAAFHKPILGFFGISGIEKWHPWQVPYIALQPPSKVVADITVEEAFAGFLRLQTLLQEKGLPYLSLNSDAQ